MGVYSVGNERRTAIEETADKEGDSQPESATKAIYHGSASRREGRRREEPPFVTRNARERHVRVQRSLVPVSGTSR